MFKEKSIKTTQKRRPFIDWENIKVPHTYVIIFTILLVGALMTYLLPAGEYTMVEGPGGRKIVDPDSYHFVESSRAGLRDILNAVPAGMNRTSTLIFFVFIMGGSFQIIAGTGAIDAAISRLAHSLEGKEKFIIPIFATVFSIFGGLIGMTTECLVFLPIGIRLCRRVGYDALVGTSMIILGAYVGFVAGTFNPFNVGVAQGIAELPLYSGLGLRVVLHIVVLVATCLYIMRYAEKIRENPEKSMIWDIEEEARHSGNGELDHQFMPLSVRHYFVLALMGLCFSYVIYGVTKFEWGIGEIIPVFLGLGIFSGFIGGLGPSRIATEFIKGAKTMVFGALVIGVARGILVILEQGRILDTIVFYLSHMLNGLPPQLTAVGMYVVHILINFVIPSGSAQASVTMPVMAPLADIVGLSRQTSVLAFQLGDGFTNGINPTSSTVNASIAVSGMSIVQWIRFSAPIIAIQLLIGLVFLLVAVAIGY